MLEGYCTTATSAYSRFNILRPRGPGIPMSAEAGQRVQFHIHSNVEFTFQVVRLRSPADVLSLDSNLSATVITDDGPREYDGTPVDLPPRLQTSRDQPFAEGCGWSVNIALEFPADWRSGFYAAICRGAGNSDFYIPFIVKPSHGWIENFLNQPKRSRFAMLASTNTWNAYNTYGGKGYYPIVFEGPYYAGKLSFERPFPYLRPCAPSPFDQGVDTHTRHQLRADLWLFTWLEDNGYQIDLFTDLDFHFGLFDPADYAGLILGTHPEYWTMKMRDRVETYLHQGGRLIYLGGNGLFERVISDPLDLTKLEFRPKAPYANKDRWFFRKQGRFERSVLGVAYYQDYWQKPATGYRAKVPKGKPAHRFFNDVELPDGSPIVDGSPFGDVGLTGTAGTSDNGCACGWEMDSTWVDADPSDVNYYAGPIPDPEAVVVIAESSPSYTQMTAWDTPWKGLVYSVGSVIYTGSLVLDPVLQQILRNVLNECLPPLPPMRVDPRVQKWLEDALRWPIDGPVPPGPVETPENEIMTGLLIMRLASHSGSDVIASQLREAGLAIVTEATQRALRSTK